MVIRTRPPQPESDTASPEDSARFKALMEGHQFHVARSMPDIPHSYTRRREWAKEGNPPGELWDHGAGDSDFVWAAQFVQTYGTPRDFFSKTFIYYDLDGHEYWTMGAPPEETEIINRAELSDGGWR